MCRWQWMKNLKYDLSWFSHSLFLTFEMILRAVAGQRSPRELSPRKSGGAHLRRRVSLRSAAPRRKSALPTLMSRIQTGAIQPLQFRYATTFSIYLEITGDGSADDAWMPARIVLS